MIIYLRTLLFTACLLILFMGCSTYNTKSVKYQSRLMDGNTEGALKEIEKNKFLKKNNNKLLYLFEKGKVEYLNGNFAASNDALNKADSYLESQKKSTVNRVVGTLTNPENQPYFGEDFEKVAIHYYKALNYVFLNQPDEALVEVKRINLQLQKLNDSYTVGKTNRYNTDAFAMILQGLLYEYSGDINDAFIAYRNAADLYLKHDGTYFNVPMPNQLKQDLLRTAKIMGFQTDVDHYSKEFSTVNFNGEQQKTEKNVGGELVIFWENGLAPYKDQTYYSFSILPGNRTGYVLVQNEELDISLPIPIKNKEDDKEDFSDLDIFNLAYPKYVTRQPTYSNASIKLNDATYSFELTEDFNTIAIETLRDRRAREIGEAAVRLASKKMAQYSLKSENSELGAILGVLNALTEHADTRNWQTLPSNIQYARIPLEKGENNIEIEFVGQNSGSLRKSFVVQGNGRLQFEKVVTLDSTLPRF